MNVQSGTGEGGGEGGSCRLGCIYDGNRVLLIYAIRHKIPYKLTKKEIFIQKKFNIYMERCIKLRINCSIFIYVKSKYVYMRVFIAAKMENY